MKIDGLDELSKNLKRLEEKANKLDGEHSIPLNEVLTSTFVSKHTSFGSVDEMLEASGFKIETSEDFSAIPDEKWDEFIRSVSSFSDWQDMLGAAGQEWAAKQLGL